MPYAYALLVTSVFNMASTSSSRINHSTNNGGGDDGVADGESQILGGASPSKLRPAHGQMDTSKCIICQETKRKGMTNKPQASGIKTVLNSAAKRQDKVYYRLHGTSAVATESIKYHRQCYQSYTNNRNIVFCRKRQASLSFTETYMETGEPHTKLPKLQRKQTNWNICVICQCISYCKNRTLHKIQTEDSANSLKEAAHERNDEEMLTRIETVNLIATNAVYHKNCKPTYESSRSIRAAQKYATDQEVNEYYDQAFQQLIADVHVGLMFERQIFTLTQLLQCLKSKFPSGEDVSALRADKLQKKLIEHYGKDILILTQQGQSKSSFVLRSDISVLEALKTATQLKSNLKSKQMEDAFLLDTDTEGEEIRILHQAAGIIHKALDESPRLKKSDTDVFVLAVHHFMELNNTDELWFQTEVLSTNKDMHRYIPVHDLCKSLDPMLIKILPPVHAITECDTTSSFFRIGKVTVMNTIKKAGANSFKGLASFHNMNPDEATDEARKLTARLYDPKGKFLRDHSNLNVLRSKITATKDVPIAQLTPSEASFKEHAKRVLWQSKVWANARIGLPDLGNPQDYGWGKVNNIMTPIMFKGPCSAEC